MKKLIFLIVLINLFGYKTFSQQFIIAGPQNDCAKGISKNVHTDSKDFDIDGYTKLKITTHQHRTFDNSKIFDIVNDKLLWEWKGESFAATWYVKEHFIEVNAKKIRVEFTQGYSDPFCDGFIKVENISSDNQGAINNFVENKALNNPKISPGPYKLTPFLDDGLWGYKNEGGEIVIKPKFEVAAPFYLRNHSYNAQTGEHTFESIKELTVAKYKNEWVLINEKGKIKEKLDADEVSLKYNKKSWIYRKNDKYGVILHDGKILSKPIYDFIIPTNKRDRKYGPNQHENIDDFIYQKNGKIGVSSLKTSKSSRTEIYETIPADYYQFYDYNMNPIDFNFKVNSCVLWGDESGDISLGKTFRKKSDEYLYYGYASEPIQVDSISPPINTNSLQRQNYSHKELTPLLPSNWFTTNEVVELRKIKKNGKYGIVCNYPTDIYLSRNSINYDKIIYDSITFSDYYATITAYLNGKCGLIDHWGQNIIDFKYDKILPLGQNYFALQKDNLWGISYLDSIIFLPKYNDYKLIENNWHLKKEDNWGVFSHDGKMLCDFKYNEIQDFENFNGEVKFAKVIDNNKVGLINQNFEEVLAPKYGEVLKIQLDNNTKDLFVFVKEGGLYGSVNLNKSKIDNIYNKSSNYNSIEELENQIIIHKEQIKEEKRIAEERRLAEEKQAEARRLEEEKQAEARRVEEEKRQRKIQMAEEQVRQKELKKMYAQLQSTTINYISRFLKNPDGASWISYNGPEETRRQLNESRNYLPNCDNVFATMITVDATNSFGGNIRSTYIVFFKDNYPCHFEDIKAIDKARNSASRIGDMNNMLSLTLQLNGCGCK
jgi:hypothetical protein